MESLLMLIMYVVYCVCLYFNPRLEQWAQTLPVPCKKIEQEQEGPVTYKTLDDGPALESPDKINFGAPPGENGAGMPQPQQQQAYYRSREADPNEVLSNFDELVCDLFFNRHHR